MPVRVLRASLRSGTGTWTSAMLSHTASLGLADRGEIAPGKRADLVQVRLVETSQGLRQPVVRAVWRQGRRIA